MGASVNTSTVRSRSIGAGGQDALVTREVDALISRLLGEIKVPFNTIGKRALTNLADLKRVLGANYLEESDLPEPRLLKELAKIVKSDIKSYDGNWKTIDSPEVLGSLFKKFGPREIEIRAEPYRQGAGLALRGFFCRTSVGERNKFVIFVNTAHHPGAVAATLGHELGHYIYGSLAGEQRPMTAFMEGTFASHLHETDELFADSLVALSAYSKDMIKDVGAIYRPTPGESDELFGRIRKAYGMLQPRFKIDLAGGKLQAAMRVRYLASMTHFFKLRCALHRAADI